MSDIEQEVKDYSKYSMLCFYKNQVERVNLSLDNLIEENLSIISDKQSVSGEKLFENLIEKVELDIHNKDILELKILVLHKNIEKVFKRHLEIIGLRPYDYYKFDKIKEVYIKEVDIYISKCKFYSSIKEVYEVSNAIKHSRVENFKNNINPKEFQNKEKLKFEDLKKFYNRVFKESFEFFEELIKVNIL